MKRTPTKKSPRKPTFSPLGSPRKPPISPMRAPSESPRDDKCSRFKSNPFTYSDFKDLCRGLVINWDEIYPSNPTKQKVCSDFFANPKSIPSIRDIPDSERVILDDLGPLSRKLTEFCSGTESTLYKGKFKKTMMVRGDTDVIYSRYRPVSRKEIINPLIVSDEVIREVENGNNSTIFILLKYLQQKHPDACVVFGYPDSIKYTYDVRIIDNSEIPALDDPILARGENPDNYYAIIPETESTSRLHEPLEIHFDDGFIRKYQLCRKKYILGLIEIKNLHCERCTHSNAFIIDKPNKIFYVYEPDGVNDIYQHFYFKTLKSTLKSALSTDFTIIPFGGTCDIKGIQKLEKEMGEDPISDAVISDPGGYCSYYSVWILDMVLDNPDIPPEKIQGYAIRYIRKIRDFIRGFGVFINSIMKDYEILLERNKSIIRKNPFSKIYLLNSIINFYLDLDVDED